MTLQRFATNALAALQFEIDKLGTAGRFQSAGLPPPQRDQRCIIDTETGAFVIAEQRGSLVILKTHYDDNGETKIAGYDTVLTDTLESLGDVEACERYLRPAASAIAMIVCGEPHERSRSLLM